MMDYPGILLRPIALLRKEQVWMAEGDDLAIYNANKSIIQSLLKHSGIPESDHNLWIGIYRIGTSQEQARPAIVVSCLDPKVRKQAKGSIKSCSLFRQGGAFAHFAILGKATPPELPCEPQLTMASYTQEHEFTASSLSRQPKEHTNQENTQGQIVLQVFESHTGDNYLCRPIRARRGLQTQSATAGPLLVVDGASYQLTVEHLVNFDRHKSEPTWEHTNDDWDDDDDDDDDEDDDEDAGEYHHVKGMASSDSGTVCTMSEGSLSSEDDEIDFSGSSSSGSAQEIHGNTSWSPMVPASATASQSFLEPKTVGHIIVNDCSCSPPIEPVSSPRCYAGAIMDYLLFPIHASPDPELCTTRGAEMVQPSDVFDVHKQTKARPVIITTASLGYVRGIIFPASTLLQKSGSRSFQTLFCIESAFPIPKGTSGSAVFDSQTGLLAGYLVLGCPGKRTCYMVPILDVLAELNTHFGSIVQCHVQLNVSAIVEVPPENSALAKLAFPIGGLNQSILHQPLEPLSAATMGADHHQSDDWTKRFSHKAKPLGPGEGRPILDTLREHMPGFSEVRMFMSTDSESPGWKRTVSRIEHFCEGASFVLDCAVPNDAGNPHIKDIQEPIAWVSDQRWAPEGLQPHKRVQGGPLDCIELHKVLQRKCIRDDTRHDKIVPPRRIYINNPNGASILALIRAIPASQAEGLRKLLADYVTTNPRPYFGLREPQSQFGGCFIISFNIPYYGIATKVLQDARTISNGKSRLRSRYDLSFLFQNIYESGSPGNETSFFRDSAFLHEAVYSLTVTGNSDKYWTAACLDDDVLDQMLSCTPEEDYDPIIKENVMSADTSSPRSYALASLLAILREIVEQQTLIRGRFEDSFYYLTSNIPQDPGSGIPPEDLQKWLNSFRGLLGRVTRRNSELLRTMDKFLFQDLLIREDGLPHGRLWRSLQSDPGVIKSLQNIIGCRNSLEDTQHALLQFLLDADRQRSNLTVERKHFHSDEQKIRSVLRIAAALTLAFGLYVYGSRLEWIVPAS